MTQTTPPRLIDLHIDWMAQYRGETPDSGEPCPLLTLSRLDGYLSTTRAAFLFDDSPPTPARSVDSWLARALAEFPGRILAIPEDYQRWQVNEPEPLCWAVLSLGPAFTAALAQHNEQLHRLAERGVRVFSASNHPLPILIPALLDLAVATKRIFAIDLADLNDTAQADTLSWLEADPARPARLVPIISRAKAAPPEIVHSPLSSRIADLDGLIAIQFTGLSPAEVRSALDTLMAVSDSKKSSIALATDFLSPSTLTPELARVDLLLRSILESQEPAFARSIIEQNAVRLIARLTS